jgi:hypothetical protein
MVVTSPARHVTPPERRIRVLDRRWCRALTEFAPDVDDRRPRTEHFDLFGERTHSNENTATEPAGQSIGVEGCLQLLAVSIQPRTQQIGEERRAKTARLLGGAHDSLQRSETESIDLPEGTLDRLVIEPGGRTVTCNEDGHSFREHGLTQDLQERIEVVQPHGSDRHAITVLVGHSRGRQSLDIDPSRLTDVAHD